MDQRANSRVPVRPTSSTCSLSVAKSVEIRCQTLRRICPKTGGYVPTRGENPGGSRSQGSAMFAKGGFRGKTARLRHHDGVACPQFDVLGWRFAINDVFVIEEVLLLLPADLPQHVDLLHVG